MASKVKLLNANGKAITVSNNDGNNSDLDVSYFTTVADITAATATDGSVAILTDEDRGGTFIYDSTATNNGGTVFGKWKRQYSGAVNVKWFGVDDTGATNETATFALIDAEAMARGAEIYLDWGYYSVDDFPTSNTIGEGILRVGGIDQPAYSRYKVTTNSARSIVKYETAHTVRISAGVMSFEGFRAKGQYLKKPTKVLTSTPSVVVDNSVGGNLGLGFATRPQEHWYAVFAVANEKDTSVTFVTVPYFRVHSIDSPTSQIYLMAEAGEGIHGTSGGQANYDYNTSELVGSDILYCSETINGVANALSDTTAQITAASASSLVVTNLSSVNQLDYVLVAPKYDHYRYCGSFYEDTTEIRNIADSGSLVMSRGIYNLSYPQDGSATTATRVPVAGYICPLATSVSINIYFTINDTTTGDTGTRILIDSTHDIHFFYERKETGRVNFQSATFEIPFSFAQEYYAYTVPLGTRTNEQHNTYGWIEN